MIKERIGVSIKTKFGTSDFVFASRLIAIKFVLDESRRKEVISFSVNYFRQHEVDSIDFARSCLQDLIDKGSWRKGY